MALSLFDQKPFDIGQRVKSAIGDGPRSLSKPDLSLSWLPFSVNDSLAQQQLEIFDKTNRDHDGRPGDSSEEQNFKEPHKNDGNQHRY